METDRFTWTKTEKKIAKQACDTALAREYAALLQQLKDMSANAETPEDIWKIQSFLNKQEKQIDNKYDYSYSVLLHVFTRLIREKWLEEKHLEGLSEDKLNAIRYTLSF